MFQIIKNNIYINEVKNKIYFISILQTFLNKLEIILSVLYF